MECGDYQTKTWHSEKHGKHLHLLSVMHLRKEHFCSLQINVFQRANTSYRAYYSLRIIIKDEVKAVIKPLVLFLVACDIPGQKEFDLEQQQQSHLQKMNKTIFNCLLQINLRKLMVQCLSGWRPPRLVGGKKWQKANLGLFPLNIQSLFP